MLIRSCAPPCLIKVLSVLFVLAIGSLSSITADARWRPTTFVSASPNFLLVTPSEPPRLLTHVNSSRAIALEAITLRTEPFSLNQLDFGPDSRTRLILFATNIDAAIDGDLYAFSADAEDGQHRLFPLMVESVSRAPVSEAIYEIHLRLNAEMIEDGDVLVRLYCNGIPSNRVRVGLGRLGGGLPDDGGPQITLLSPSSVMAETSPPTLSVSGSNFTLASKLFFNGTERSANLSSDNLLISTLTSEDVATASNISVYVRSGVEVSNTVTFTVNNPQPSLEGLSPASVTKGGSAFTLGVSGSGFVQGSVVKFNGNNRVTAFVSATLLTAQILASDIAVAGSLPVRVVNPAPGGGSSSDISLVVTNPVPTPTPTPSPTATPTPTPLPEPSPIPYDTAIRQTGLWGYWRLSETSGSTFADSSGNGHHLSMYNSPTLGAGSLLKGSTNKSATFNGIDEFAQSGAEFTSLRAISISMLIKVPVTGSSIGLFSAGLAGSSLPNHSLTLSSENTLTWRWRSATGTRTAASGTSIVPGRLHHIVLTHDYTAGIVTVYIDGARIVLSTTAGDALPVIAGKINIARRSDGAHFPGTMDEAAVFTSALSAESVEALFRSARAIAPGTTTFYASPTGTFEASGTLADPFDLQSVLRMPGVLNAGKTLELLAGTYSDSRTPGTITHPNFIITVSGAAGNPLIIRPRAGGVAKIDGGLHKASTLDIRGSYIHFIELEVFKSDTTRTTDEVGPDPAIPIGIGALMGFYHNSVGNKMINCRLHDGGIAVATQTGSELEAYGNLIYNMGWMGGNNQAWGEGFYVQNDSDVEKLLEDNIVFNGYKRIFFQLRYNTSNRIQRNIRVRNNTTVNGGIELLRGLADAITFDGNQVYNGRTVFGENTTGMGAGTFLNNRVYSGPNGETPSEFSFFNSLTVMGNEFIQGSGGSQIILRYNSATGQSVANSLFSNNKYWRGRANKPTLFETQAYSGGVVSDDERTFAGWRTHIGADGIRFDSNSDNVDSPAPAKPTENVTIVRPNRYKQGRANVVIWNWENLSSLRVNLSETGLISGQRYEVRNAFNWDAGPILTGTYNPVSPNMYLTPTTDRALRIGAAASTPQMSKEFQVFIVVPRP